MIHHLTIPFRLRMDYMTRGVFSRYHGMQHIMMDDISVKVGTPDLQALLTDAESHSTVRATGAPLLTLAYVQFAKKLRELLRREAENADVGRDGKSAATGERDAD